MTSPAERRTTVRPKMRARASKRQPRSPAPDPYRYGWRYVKRQRDDGTIEFDQVPLTLEDFLHPEEEDFRVQTDAHDDDCAYLKYVIRTRLPAGWVVLSDCRVDWGVPGIRAHGPDLVAFRNVRRRIDWATFYVAKEKARPVLVVEVTSPDTRSKDLIDKVDHYYRAGVPFYFIVDVFEETDETRLVNLIGYRRGKTGYVAMKPDREGRFLLKALGLLLGVEAARVCCYDALTGDKIGDYEAIVKERLEAQQQAQAAQQQAQAAQQQAQAAQQQAQAAQQQAQQAHERIRQLEAENRRLRGET